jgi:hypothetical protein
VSSVLAITYATMNRNIIVGRRNQERTEASKLGQGQIEALKNLARTNEAELIAKRDSPFCMVGTQVVSLVGGVPDANNLNNDDFANYIKPLDTNNDCQLNSLYHIGIRYTSSGRGLYKVYVRWDQLGGTRGEVVTVYGL